MKVLSFKPELAEKILAGRKTKTWRMFDDKDLSVGDEVEFRVSGSGKVFALVAVTDVKTKTLGTADSTDYSTGQEPSAPEQLLEEFRGYYGEQVTLETPVKIVSFEIIPSFGSSLATAD